jgi:hypothetical protein
LRLETLFWALFEPGRNAVIPNITSSHDESLVANALSSSTWSVRMQYVRRDSRLFAMLFVKGGIGFLGANWVLLPIYGARIFPVQGAGMSAAQQGMLGMSLLMGCRGIRALLGPLVAGRWSGGNQRRFRLGIIMLGIFVAMMTGVALLLPAGLWALAQRLWRP